MVYVFERVGVMFCDVVLEDSRLDKPWLHNRQKNKQTSKKKKKGHLLVISVFEFVSDVRFFWIMHLICYTPNAYQPEKQCQKIPQTHTHKKAQGAHPWAVSSLITELIEA